MSSSDPSLPPPIPVLPYGGEGPVSSLNAEQMGQLIQARVRAKTLRRVKFFAAMDGYSALLLGLGTLACGGYASVTPFVLGAGMIAVGLIELWAIKQWEMLKPEGARYLGYNQLFFGALVIFYGAVGFFSAGADLTKVPDYDIIRQQFGDIGGMVTAWSRLVYSLIILEGIVVQGGFGLYYLSREKILRRYLEETPPWITQMQRIGINIG